MLLRSAPVDYDAPKLIREVHGRPYSPVCRMRLASSLAAVKYPDLASGEAYMTLLLCDEIYSEDADFHDFAVEAAEEDMKATSNGDMLTDWIRREIEYWA